LDQAKWKKQQQTQTIEKLTAVLSTAGVGDPAAALTGSSSPPPAASAPATQAASAATSSSDERTARLREAIARCFGS